MCLDDVSSRSGVTTMAGPVGVEELTALLVNTFVSVGTEVITLGLSQVSGQASSSQTVEVSQSGGDGRDGDTASNGEGSNASPTRLLLYLVNTFVPKLDATSTRMHELLFFSNLV